MPEHVSPDGASNEANKTNLNDSNTATVHLELDESKAHLINANGGAGGDHDELKTEIVDPTSASSDGEISFSGLGKEEVMRYANDPFWVRLRWILFILFWVGWLAMLVTAIVIIVLAPRCPPRPDLKWYQTDTVYQVLPKSFKDSNGDGVGDFEGLTSKLSYITDLGVKAIWINNIYLTDSNSGVLDHKDISPSFGVSLDQFKGWLKKLRKEGLKIILDLIPNHTSKNHTWFKKSQNQSDKYTNYYIWANASSGPPSNWTNVQNDSAWTFDTVRKSYYFHQFSKDYPDLNLTNEDVITEIKEIMKFWLEAGVSGFHIEGVEYLVENHQDLSAPNDDKRQTRNYVGTLSLLEELRKVADAYSDKPGREKLLFGTVEYANENQTLELWGSGEKKRLHVVAPILKDLDANCRAGCIKQKTDELLTQDENHWLGLQLGNQNTPRVASRMDYLGEYKSRLIIAFALQLFLPGTPFNYYGDEFGQKDGQESADAVNNYRTPMQWDNQAYAGFTETNSTPPYIPVAKDYQTNNVQASLAVFSSKLAPLNVFKDLVKWRSKESFQWGKPTVCTPHNDLLLFSRKATRFPYFVIAINTGTSGFHVSPPELECVPIKDGGKILFHSQDKHLADTDGFKNGIFLGPLEVVIFEFPADEE